MRFFFIMTLLLEFLMCHVAAAMVMPGFSPPNMKRESPAIPGAQGFGTATPGGGGGQVYRIKSLAAGGPGSLREALEATGPRIILFEVAGNIFLREMLVIDQPFVTVVGQSAPSPGITLRGAGIRIQTHDVALQHLRIRIGDDPAGPSPGSRDGLQVIGSSAYNIVADHLSISWAIDENISVTRGAHDVTISNCLVSEGLNRSLHPEGAHSMGILVGEGCHRIAIIRNLLAHNGERNPRIKGDTSVLAVNNLAYNSGGNAFVVVGSEDGPSLVSLVGNVFLPGPDSPQEIKAIHFSSRHKASSRIYLRDNLLGGKRAFAPSAFLALSPLVWHYSVKVYAARRIERLLPHQAGARPWERDGTDRRIAREVLMRSGRIIDSPNDVGDWSWLAPNGEGYYAKPEPSISNCRSEDPIQG